MKKYLIFILILTIMTINTVKGETTTNFVEAWSVDVQNIYTLETKDTMMTTSHKSIAYKDGFAVTSVNAKKYKDTEEVETTLAIYDRNGKMTKSIIIANNEGVVEMTTINDSIYAIQADITIENPTFKIVKYDENLNKIAETKTVYCIEFYYLTVLININLFTSHDEKLYVISSDFEKIIEYDENLEIIKETNITSDEDLEIISQINPEFYNFLISTEGQEKVYIGYTSKEDYEIYSGSYNGVIGMIKIIKDNNETENGLINNHPCVISPKILNSNVIALTMSVSDSWNWSEELIVIDFDGNQIQKFSKENTIFLNLTINEKTNAFMVTEVETKGDCNEGNSICMVLKNTIYKEGVILENSNDISPEIFGQFKKTSDNGYISVGSSSSTNLEGITNQGETDAIIAKYDENFNIEWIKNYGGSADDSFVDVIELPDGYIAVGESYSTDISGITNKGESDAIIVKYDKNGNVLWQKSWGGNDYDYYNAIKSLNNHLIALGSTESKVIIDNVQTDKYVGVIIQYDTDGNILKQINNNTDYFDILNLPENEYVIIATNSTYQILTKYDKNNNKIWELSIPDDHVASHYRELKGVVLTDGSILTTGLIARGADGLWNKIAKITPDGKLVWQDTAEVSSVISNCSNILATEDGGFLLSRMGFKTLISNNEEQITVKSPTRVIKISSKDEVEWSFSYPMNNDTQFVHTFPFINQIIDKGNNEFIIVGGIEYLTNDGSRSFSNIFSELSFKYIIEQEETTNGTYEVKQENGKGIITLNPEKGYTLDTLTITNAKGEQVEYYEKDGKYYFDLTAAITVNVTYKEDISNPNTITFLKLGLIAVIIFAIYNLFISRKIKIKRFV